MHHIPENSKQESAIANPLEETNIGSSDYRLLLRFRWLIAKITVMCAFVFCLIAVCIPSKYESVAQLMPPDQDASSSMGQMMLSEQNIGSAFDLLGAKSSGALFIKIMSSETVENSIIDQFGLRSVYKTRYPELARAALEKNTSIDEDRKSGVITIRVQDTDRARARKICQAYIVELNRLSSQLSTSAARREREFLEQRLSVTKAQVDQATEALGQFSSMNSTVDIPQQTRAILDTSSTLQGELIAKESELEGLKQIYSDQNLRVRSTEASIGELRKNQSLMDADPNALGKIGHTYPTIRKLPLLGEKYEALLRSALLSESIFEALTKQYETAKVQEAKDLPSVRVLDAPSYPEKKIYPPRSVIVFIGGFIGFVLSVAWVIWVGPIKDNYSTLLIAETRKVLNADLARAMALLQRNGKD